MSLFHRFQTQCQTYLPNTNFFLVGLSGGMDSVALLHLFSRTSFKVRAIYIHHGLSPNADHWAEFCAQYCKRLNIPFILQKVYVDKSNGIENGARAARYQAFKQHLNENEVIVTAHHLDDQAETFLLALKRGSGIKGLSAMQVVHKKHRFLNVGFANGSEAVNNPKRIVNNFLQNFTVFRPLLNFSKAELAEYAAQHKLRWIEDESNADSRFDRNFLRNEILPKLNQRWSHFNEMVARSAQHCAEQQALIEELLSDELKQRMGEKQQLSIVGFTDFSPAKQQQLVRLWLEKCSVPMPSKSQLQAVIFELIFAKADKNPQFKMGDKVLRRYQQAIFITEELEAIPPFEMVLNTETELELPYQLGKIIRHNQEIICKKIGKNDRLLLPIELANSALSLIIGQQGKVKCYGKPHREEMKKIWQAYGVPAWERDRTPLIFWQDKLIACLS
ncbi:tRNA lysidine(34) synthetase TilS [Mannheimia granulomatis]|uniref:tRNA lysidine(34) synthetase TilS n=1 Tax=Mannheimia granulomatis TaxID=85402 RepID=UPI00159D5293|nr:tRNA lysidine(34) synthetase TilS [Mannheimia granulomatis]QLB15726.1 tRNA lysidine(34) synthetase TilS [Mannheimia granulomatis]